MTASTPQPPLDTQALDEWRQLLGEGRCLCSSANTNWAALDDLLAHLAAITTERDTLLAERSGNTDTTHRMRLYVALTEQRVIDSQKYGEAPYAPITWEDVTAILDAAPAPTDNQQDNGLADEHVCVTEPLCDGWPYSDDDAFRAIAAVANPGERKEDRDGWAVTMRHRPALFEQEAKRATERLHAAIAHARAVVDAPTTSDRDNT